MNNENNKSIKLHFENIIYYRHCCLSFLSCFLYVSHRIASYARNHPGRKRQQKAVQTVTEDSSLEEVLYGDITTLVVLGMVVVVGKAAR